MRITIGLSLLVASVFAWGAPRGTQGKIEIVGKGLATSAPEFATVTTTVVSVCNDSLAEAKDAAETAGARLARVLETYRRIERDRVLVHKEVPQKKTETASDGKTPCQNKWRAAQTYTLRFAQLSLLNELQNELFAMANEVSAVPGPKQTYFQLGQPSFHLSEDTYARLKRESQEQAWADARSQFDEFDHRCKFARARLSDSSTPDWNAFSRSFSADSGSRTAVAPDEILVEAVWKFVWAFEGASCSKEAR